MRKTFPWYIWLSWLMFIPFCVELAYWSDWFFIKKRTFMLWCMSVLIATLTYGILWIPAFLAIEYSFERDSVSFIILSIVFGYFCGVCATQVYTLWREKFIKRT